MKPYVLAISLSLVFSALPSLAADTNPTKATQQTKARVSKEEAEKTALKSVPGGEVLGWDLEVEKGVPTYSFDIKAKDGRVKEVEVDGNSGRAGEISIEIEEQGEGTDRKTTNKKDLAAWKRAKVTKEKAEEAALKKVPGEVKRWESELERGAPQYEFLISSKDEGDKVVEVNAVSGKVTEVTTFVEGNAI